MKSKLLVIAQTLACATKQRRPQIVRFCRWTMGLRESFYALLTTNNAFLLQLAVTVGVRHQSSKPVADPECVGDGRSFSKTGILNCVSICQTKMIFIIHNSFSLLWDYMRIKCASFIDGFLFFFLPFVVPAIYCCLMNGAAQPTLVGRPCWQVFAFMNPSYIKRGK